jgi:rod shape-determining protein MreC
LVLGLLLLVSFTLITLDLRGGSTLPGNLRRTVSTVFSPLQSGTRGATTPVGNFFHRLTHDDSKTIENLKRSNDALQRQLEVTQDAQRKAAQLDSLLKMAGLDNLTIIPARVMAVGPVQGFDLTVEIDAGTRDGLHPDMTVINGQGLVGRVKYVTADTATVVLLIDPDSGIGVRVESSGQIGILTGKGRRPMQLVVQNRGHVLQPGDILETLGSVGYKPYVPGIPIGTVKSVTSVVGALDQVATVVPYVDIDNLDLLGVVVEAPNTTPRTPITGTPPSGSTASPSVSGSNG